MPIASFYWETPFDAILAGAAVGIVLVTLLGFLLAPRAAFACAMLASGLAALVVLSRGQGDMGLPYLICGVPASGLLGGALAASLAQARRNDWPPAIGQRLTLLVVWGLSLLLVPDTGPWFLVLLVLLVPAGPLIALYATAVPLALVTGMNGHSNTTLQLEFFAAYWVILVGVIAVLLRAVQRARTAPREKVQAGRG